MLSGVKNAFFVLSKTLRSPSLLYSNPTKLLISGDFWLPKNGPFLRPKLNPKSEKRLENYIRRAKQTKSPKAQDRRITYEEPKGHRFWTRSLFINILLYIAVVKYIRVNFRIIRTQRSRICDLIKSTPPTLTCSLQWVLN